MFPHPYIIALHPCRLAVKIGHARCKLKFECLWRDPSRPAGINLMVCTRTISAHRIPGSLPEILSPRGKRFCALKLGNENANPQICRTIEQIRTRTDRYSCCPSVSAALRQFGRLVCPSSARKSRIWPGHSRANTTGHFRNGPAPPAVISGLWSCVSSTEPGLDAETSVSGVASDKSGPRAVSHRQPSQRHLDYVL